MSAHIRPNQKVVAIAKKLVIFSIVVSSTAFAHPVGEIAEALSPIFRGAGQTVRTPRNAGEASQLAVAALAINAQAASRAIIKKMMIRVPLAQEKEIAVGMQLSGSSLRIEMEGSNAVSQISNIVVSRPLTVLEASTGAQRFKTVRITVSGSGQDHLTALRELAREADRFGSPHLYNELTSQLHHINGDTVVVVAHLNGEVGHSLSRFIRLDGSGLQVNKVTTLLSDKAAEELLVLLADLRRVASRSY